jgi:hypothetical protein
MTTIEAEQAIRSAVADASMSVFKLDVDENSVLLSVDVPAGDKSVRKATYVPFAEGRLVSAVTDTKEWIDRVRKGIPNGPR